MEKINLKANTREITGKKVSQLRNNGLVPAVIYGKDHKPVSLQIDVKNFKHAFEKAGHSALIDLAIDDKNTIKTIIHDVQFDPVTDEPLHVDLYAIKMDEKIETEIPLNFIGVSPAVKDLEGSLIKNFDELEVECLPKDLVHEIKVDISSLKTFDDVIRLKDIEIPDGITPLQDKERVVALVNPPRSEEELEELESETANDAEKEQIEKMEKEAEAEKAEKEAEKEESKETGKTEKAEK